MTDDTASTVAADVRRRTHDEAMREIARILTQPQDEALLAVWRHVLHSDHGSFLKHFARAILSADAENLDLLRSTAGLLMEKYQLWEDVK